MNEMTVNNSRDYWGGQLNIIKKEFAYIREQLSLNHETNALYVLDINIESRNNAILDDTDIVKEFKKLREELSIDTFAA